MKLLVDMNLSPNWVAEFQSRGVESIHWSGLGSASATDEEILAWCASHDPRTTLHEPCTADFPMTL